MPPSGLTHRHANESSESHQIRWHYFKTNLNVRVASGYNWGTANAIFAVAENKFSALPLLLLSYPLISSLLFNISFTLITATADDRSLV